MVATRSWKLTKQEFDPAPELTEALDATVARLGLTPA